MGREAVAYHPATCGISEEGEIAEFSSEVMKTSLFDALDRPIMEILPADEAGGGESITKMAYSIATDKKLLKTTITAPNGDISHSYADGGGQTVLAERFDPVSNEVVPINYYFDAIGQLDSLTDAGGNTTRYTYDMAGRTLSVSHPSVGLTTMKYDIAGNVLEKVTENLRKEEKLIKYEYDYNRLKKVTYPNHPENDVTYTYGGPNARENRVGRLALLEDGSGATEYSYGRMGEVTKQRRTLVIPNVAVATYTTEWNYDSHNRLQEMIYPDGEKVKYFYNLGGQLSSIVGEKEYLYRYIDSTGYDAYEQKVYQRMGNGAVTTYDYSKERRRLKNLTVTSPKVTGGAIMNNAYGYDVMDNIISLVNKATPQIMQNGKSIGGEIEHTYTYDDWSRLVHADGEFVAGAKSATYDLTMGYDKLYNITSKKLDVTQNNFQFDGTLKAGHDFTYKYDPKDPFRLLSVDAKEYRSSTEEVDTTRREHSYAFDGNGNLVLQLSDLVENIDSASFADTAAMQVRQYLWDEDNRMLAANVNGFVSNYFYDAVGERTVKISAPDLAVFVNSAKALGNDSTLTKFVGYVSPYLVVSNGGRYTKHIYAGTQRIASKLGDIEAFGADPRRVEYAGANLKEVDFGAKYKKQTSALFARYDSLGVEHRPNTLNDYVGGQSFCCGEKELVSNNQTGDNTFETPDYEHLIFFYHPDHLGSTALVTDNSGNVVQSVAYIPYGEVFIEERNGTWNTPYLFNGKELDEETGLYYYGARYLNPTNGMWLSTDPLFEKYVGMSPYNYCNLNPLRFVDPTGMAGWEVQESNGAMWYNENLTSENVAEGFKYFDSKESASLYSNRIKAENWTEDNIKDYYDVATSQSTSFANDAIGGVSSSLPNVSAGKISEATADALNNTVKPNPKLVNVSKGLGKLSTRVTVITAVGVSGVEIYKCAQGKTSFKEGSKKSGAQIGSAVGSYLGGLLGGAFGGVAGASVGPVGAVVGGAAGGAYGAYVGDVVGSYFGELAGSGIGCIGEYIGELIFK